MYKTIKGYDIMNKIQRLTARLKKIKGLRLNKLYKICEQQGFTAQEIELVKYFINRR